MVFNGQSPNAEQLAATVKHRRGDGTVVSISNIVPTVKVLISNVCTNGLELKVMRNATTKSKRVHVTNCGPLQLRSM